MASSPVPSRPYRAVARLARLIRRHPGLSQTHKLVALELLDALDLKRWRCFPSYRRLADSLGVTVRTIGRALHALKALGLLRWRRHRRASSSYEFDFSSVDLDAAPLSGDRFRDASYSFAGGIRAAARRVIVPFVDPGPPRPLVAGPSLLRSALFQRPRH